MSHDENNNDEYNDVTVRIPGRTSWKWVILAVLGLGGPGAALLGVASAHDLDAVRAAQDETTTQVTTMLEEQKKLGTKIDAALAKSEAQIQLNQLQNRAFEVRTNELTFRQTRLEAEVEEIKKRRRR